MRAVRNTEEGIEVVDVPAPDGDGVRVRVRSAGICSSDLAMLRFGPRPVTIGHEIAGVLDDGTPVAIEPILACGQCDACAGGHYNRCVRGAAATMGVGADGGMCDEIIVPSRCLVPLPADVSPADACLVEPLAVAAHGLRLAGVAGGMRVAVVGGGALGLCAVAVAGATTTTVDLRARHEHQVAAGERLGAGDASGPGTYDVVVDAAGTPSALDAVADLATPGGTILLLATYWERVPLPGLVTMMKELRIVASFMYCGHAGGREVDEAADLLARRPGIPDTIVSHRFPLEAAAEAFRVAADRRSGARKVVLEP